MGRREMMEEQSTAASQPENPPPTASPSEEPAYLGELEKLAELRDNGVISAEDFEAKKKQLLGI